jgi:hypothetical protein
MGYHQLSDEIIESILLFFRARINHRVIEEDDVQIDSARAISDPRDTSYEFLDAFEQLKKLERL